MQAARRSAAWISEAAKRAQEIAPLRSRFRDPLLHAVALRSVAEDETADLSIGPSDYVNRRHSAAARFSGMCRPANTTSGSRVLGFRCLRRPRVQAFKDCDGASQPRPHGAGWREAEKAEGLGAARSGAELLHAGSDSTAEPAEVSDPVGATPDLEPVHHQSERFRDLTAAAARREK